MHPAGKIMNILELDPFDNKDIELDSIFRDSLIEQLDFHYRNNQWYRNFCDANHFIPNQFVGPYSNIPTIPATLFKTIPELLTTIPSDKTFVRLHSSATSGSPSTLYLDKITTRRQVIAMARVMQSVLGKKKKPFLIFDLDPRSPYSPKASARSAAIKGYMNFASSCSFYLTQSTSGTELIFELEEFLKSIQEHSEPLVLFGFTYILYQYIFSELQSKGYKFKIPQGSKLIHIGGWKKLADQNISKESFNNIIAETLGILKEDVIDIYGFTEQMGLNYPDCPSGWKHIHAYSKLIIRNELTNEPLPIGSTGLLQFITPIPHSYVGNVVTTDDIGIMHTGQCTCGRTGLRFKVLARAKQSDVRGCGDIMALNFKSANNSETNSLERTKLKIFNSPFTQPFGSNLSDKQKLVTIIEQLRSNQSDLISTPVDHLITIIDSARTIWLNDELLSSEKPNGLQFLCDWLEPHRIKKLLDTSLQGSRSHLDSFIPKSSSTSSFLSAQARGLTCHWLSGNVPILGMFSIIQSLLCKNTNLVKIARNSSSVLARMIDQLANISTSTISGIPLNGTTITNNIALIYFSSDHNDLSEEFSKSADVRIAWGGAEAVNSITSLPSHYNCQDLIFGPKYSLSCISSESLNSPKSIKKILRRLSTDISVFDQYACSSPHTIFIENGGSISPHEFALKLADSLNSTLQRLPRDEPDKGLVSNIRSKVAEFQFKGIALADERLRWAVLFDECLSLAQPTFGRVVTVKPVNSISDVLPLLHPGVQSIGLSMQGQSRVDFASHAARKGVVRFPDIGLMTHFDNPWDGIYMVDKLVRWTTLGGPG